MKKYKQIQVKVINSNEAKIYLDMPHFKYPKHLATLYRDTKTLKTIQRSHINLFHLYGFRGLGINEEIILRYNFKVIEIPFNDRILRTTRNHFLKHAIPSNFVSDRVDKQLILDIEKFYIPEETPEPKEKQTEMFEESV